MNLEESIITDRSKANFDAIANGIGNDASKFKELMKLCLGSDEMLVFRSTWIMSKCTEAHPLLLLPYVDELVTQLSRNFDKTGIYRHILRSFQYIQLPISSFGPIANICFDFLTSRDSDIAVKVFSMTVLEKIISYEPDLKNELMLILENEMEFESAGYRSRAKKILKRLKNS